MATDNDEITGIAEDIASFVMAGHTIQGAVRRFRRYHSEATVTAARLEYERRIGRISSLTDPRALVDAERRSGDWYFGPRGDDISWPALERRLRAVLDDEAVDGIDQSSTRVVSLLRPPGAAEIDTRGLVLGYVQSGKTTSFTAVAAKAADVGYRFVVVLSGITDSLRNQTQRRLERDLVGEDRRWMLLTEVGSDFNASPRNAASLLSDPNGRLLAVVKKNPARLRRLVNFLNGAGETVLRECPVLLIDDEADQASIDVGTRGRQSRINSLIEQILGKPKAAYVAYTATPFANLLVDPSMPSGLYPRDFIVDLPRPSGYLGPETVFGRDPLALEERGEGADDGLDIIRHVPADEVDRIRPPRGRDALSVWAPEVVPSLAAAVRWFLLSTAARRCRQAGTQHSTMLIHTSMSAVAHQITAGPVREYVGRLRTSLTRPDSTEWTRLRAGWEEETDRLPAAAMDLPEVPWEAVADALPSVVADTRVIVDNYLSTDRLEYRDDAAAATVVIGGNTLSRGLTLEGLTCSYFVRTANAYDTVLQMGRWFGFRPGYADLARIWMTDELESWFFDLATVEAEMRQQILRYELENLEPTRLAVRIRTHPAMAITSAAKMRSATAAKLTFSGCREQTILFNHRDSRWLQHNLDAAGQLLRRATAADATVLARTPEERPIIRGVPVDLVIGFLDDYRFHPDARRMRADLLTEYIRRQNTHGALRTWNVVVMEDTGSPKDRDGGKGELRLTDDVTVNLIHRSRLDMPSIPHANIKTLVSQIDRAADVPLPRSEITALAERTGSGRLDDRLRAVRSERLGPVGLLCLYPISKDSTPLRPTVDRLPRGRRRRVALDAVEHVLGVGLFFPDAHGPDAEVNYVSADLSRLVNEDVDADVDAIDQADEDAAAARDAELEARQGRDAGRG
jgi:hypothetical protein